MSWIEVAGFTTGALSVLLFVKERVTAWPVGIANSVCWLVLFWQARLYLDASLQVVYIALGVAGWYWWLHGRTPAGELPVARTGRGDATVLALAAVVATGALWFSQVRWTDAALPFWDAVTTVVSLVAQYMLTRKLYENWYLWIAVDVAYVGMYASQGLYLTAALQPLFIALCVQGLREWSTSPGRAEALEPAT